MFWFWFTVITLCLFLSCIQAWNERNALLPLLAFSYILSSCLSLSLNLSWEMLFFFLLFFGIGTAFLHLFRKKIQA